MQMIKSFCFPKCTFEVNLKLRGQRVNCAKGKQKTSVRKASSGNRGGFFDGPILVGILKLPITGNRFPFTVGTREPKHEPLRVFGCRAGRLFLTAGTPSLDSIWTRSRVERHGALKAPRGFHDAEGLFLFSVLGQ